MENQGTVVSEFGRIKFNQTPSWKCSTKFSQPPTELKQNIDSNTDPAINIMDCIISALMAEDNPPIIV